MPCPYGTKANHENGRWTFGFHCWPLYQCQPGKTALGLLARDCRGAGREPEPADRQHSMRSGNRAICHQSFASLSFVIISTERERGDGIAQTSPVESGELEPSAPAGAVRRNPHRRRPPSPPSGDIHIRSLSQRLSYRSQALSWLSGRIGRGCIKRSVNHWLSLRTHTASLVVRAIESRGNAFRSHDPDQEANHFAGPAEEFFELSLSRRNYPAVDAPI